MSACCKWKTKAKYSKLNNFKWFVGVEESFVAMLLRRCHLNRIVAADLVFDKKFGII